MPPVSQRTTADMNTEEKEIYESLLKAVKDADEAMKFAAITTLKAFLEAVQIRIDMEE